MSMIDKNQCWHYAGYQDNGYGRIYIGGRKRLVHRILYEQEVAEIPEGYQLDHLCRERICINPAHLEVVTPRENYLRGISPAAKAARRKLCPQGHEYTQVNWGKRRRRCRTCDARWQREYQQRKKSIGMSD